MSLECLKRPRERCVEEERGAAITVPTGHAVTHNHPGCQHQSREVSSHLRAVQGRAPLATSWYKTAAQSGLTLPTLQLLAGVVGGRYQVADHASCADVCAAAKLTVF